MQIPLFGRVRNVWARSQLPLAPGQPPSSKHSSLYFEAFLFSAPFLAAAVLIKVLTLRVVGAADLQATMGTPTLSPIACGALIARDVLEAAGVFPVFLLVVGYRFPAAWRKWLYFVVLEVVMMNAVLQWAVFRTLGTFLSRSLVDDFFNTLLTNPKLVTPNMLLDRKEEIVFVGAAMGGLLALGLSYSPWCLARWLKIRRTVVFCAVGLLVLFLPLATQARNLSFYRTGVLQRTAAEIAGDDNPTEPITDAEMQAPPKELYQHLVFPTPHSDSPRSCPTEFSSPARDRPNVIFVVLETAGWDDYPLTGPDCTMTRVSELLPHALLGRRHFSTDIESVRANFSLYSSLYELPGSGDSQFFVKHLHGANHRRPLDALPRLLAEQGYTTKYYFPFTLWPKNFEEEQLGLLGFQAIRIFKERPVDPHPMVAIDAWSDLVLYSAAADKMEAERSMYQMAISDISQLHSEGKPFFLAITGSIGHAPYADLRPSREIAADPEPSRRLLVRHIAAFQDKLIGKLIDHLKALGIFEKTILVITGDHGPRTIFDDPMLDIKSASEENYHVPVVIHYPPSFPGGVRVDAVTSHVDVVPTVLELMGDCRKDYMHEGMSMLDNGIRDRITFFLGKHLRYFDALHYRGQYLMVSHTNNNVYAGPWFHFGPKDLASPDNQLAHSLARTISGLRRVQLTWIAHFRGSPALGIANN